MLRTAITPIRPRPPHPPTRPPPPPPPAHDSLGSPGLVSPKLQSARIKIFRCKASADGQSFQCTGEPAEGNSFLLQSYALAVHTGLGRLEQGILGLRQAPQRQDECIILPPPKLPV